MAFTLLLVLAACAHAQLNIIPALTPEICILYGNDQENEAKMFMGNFSQIFETYNSVTLTFQSYDTTQCNVIESLSKYDFSACQYLAVDVANSDMDFNTFLQSENNCSEYSADKIHYLQLPRNEEWFVYAKKLKFCPLSDSLIGMYCDTQLPSTYFNLSTTSTYEVTDIPEFTQMGYTFHSTDKFYVCKRITETKWISYYLFYRDEIPSGTISRQINWGNVWSNFKKIAQVIYKILDIFYNNSRTVEPRA
uniref:Outer capsid glycoprotein VP7 n=1 Tax=Rotavirus B TaxID=28876 RepID=A0A510A1L3_9REOV|nr:capsid glycoprotein VP7 [Rotavirus B]ASV45332.1 capsid glycoprotein VP7 [Rotavirus B]